MAIRLLACLAVSLTLAGRCDPVWAADDGHASAARSAHANGEASADHGASDINPIPMRWEDVQGDLAIWTAAVFLVLMVVLWRFAWRPLAEGLDKRERRIAGEIAQAKEASRKAKDVLADYHRQLATAGDQVRAIIEQGRRDAERLGQQILDQTKEEAEAEHRRAVEQIEAAAAAAIKELADHSAALAVGLAGKIVGAKLNPNDHARLIDQAVAGFVQGKSDASQN